MNTKKPLHKRIPLIPIIGAIVGAIGGYIYYIKVGCVSGTCPLTSNPWISTLWGAAAGYLVFDIFTKKKKKKNTDDENQDTEKG